MKNSFTSRWNEALLDETYQRWQENPEAVDPSWRAFFEGFELGFERSGKNGAAPAPAADETQGGQPHFQTRVDALVYAFRTMGHSIANLDPLGEAPPENPLLTLEELGFHESDLESTVSTPFFRDGKKMTLRALIDELRAIYCSTLGVEFMHIQNPKVRNWVRNRIENRDEAVRHDAKLHRELLRMLFEAESFENFLHTKYVGSKRFSLEGGEALLLILDTVLDTCDEHDVREIVMGMAHRGRLNVLANFLNKPLDLILNEFSDDYIPEHMMGSGDVKYHLGYHNTRKTPTGHAVEVFLTANPSHLEAVDPVVEGKARARQRILDDSAERKKVLPLLVHGDAAFAGQGIVAEVLNMSQLPGYRTGGTLHVIVNNQIGFTTLPADARSTTYCTDVAKMIEAPIFHVNGDDPLAVITAAETAFDFRQEFGRDVVIDMVCYRRQGHNEADEPMFTQPNLYKKIKEHERLSDRFREQLLDVGNVTQEEADEMQKVARSEMDKALKQVKEKQAADGNGKSQFAGSNAVFQPPYSHEPVNTAIDQEALDTVARALTTVPSDFKVLPKIERMLLNRRKEVHENEGPYDWSFAESLAFGSLLIEGTPVRLSGQDSRRGTFSQRHSVLYDSETRERYIPLMNVSSDQARFCVYNSLLSEAAVLGFDYGYSIDFPSMLCIWEAQFGDFANGAQVIIDQFITSAESKWARPSSLVMLLPHGYEGQGPEHSSARLERFLQLCAEDNIQVCNLTTPAQYFHALRRQVHRGYRKPLVVMTPKSLLRSDRAVSTASDFTNSHFFAVLRPEDVEKPELVTRLILCSGKVYYDLLQHREQEGLEEQTALVRVEQLYPIDTERLREAVEAFPNTKQLVWCQEEPQNMGAWTFIQPRLETLFERKIAYAGRPAAASPATGSSALHKREQETLVKEAFTV